MKKLLLLALLSIISNSLFAQLQNINPDPNGEPWMVGGFRIPDKAELDKIPVLHVSNQYAQRSALLLPQSLDNSNKAFFRPIFNQSDGSCAQSSGVAYTFTYEMNRLHGTSASNPNNQYPSHYTYDFLNGGSGDNGSFYTDGWDIVKANGCPNLTTYGGLATGGPSNWMSGYNKYESGMGNRIKDYFAIDVHDEAGLNELKLWFYDHFENSPDGGIVNFSAGVASVGFHITNNNIITKWGIRVDHAMTFVGWDDTISYDYNHDGQITNNVDTNGDGVVDMKDWERGALIMVNSWGSTWANGGKAYVMYRTLAQTPFEGGILGGKVFGIHVKQSQTPQLKMRVKMTHNKRNQIKISAGVASDVNASAPEHIIDFPLFNKQGGELPMQGISSAAIELSLDVSRLLSYVSSGSSAKFFLIVNEDDAGNSGSGSINDFSIVDNTGSESVCTQHNVSLINNDDTILSITKTINFNAPSITTNTLPSEQINTNYSYQLQAAGGNPDYQWKLLQHFEEQANADAFPNITGGSIALSDNDDGYGTQALDFTFPFYGTNYNEVYPSSDGSILFEPDFSYLRTESAIKANKVISAFASDLMIFPADGDGVFYEGDANHATFRWKTSLYGNQAANIDVAVTLYPNGDIKYFYGSAITPDLSWAAGVSDGEGNNEILSLSGDANPSNHKYLMEAEPFPIGMFVSSDGVFQGTTPNEVNTWDLDFQVTDNNDISKIKTLSFTTTTLGIEEENLFRASCYPNPVINTATFTYEIDSEQLVDFSIYDLSGRLVENLWHNYQPEGTYKLLWQPQLPAGIYVYKITTEKGSQTKQIIVK